jgi:SSS family solute:Na+ symporter
MNKIYLGYVLLYILLMMALGGYFARKVKSAEDYLIAKRKVDFWHLTGSIIATNCGAASFIGFVSLGYISGITGFFFWVIPAIAFGTLFAHVFASRLHCLKLYTIPDLFALRFGKNAAFVPSLYQIFVYSIPVLAIQFLGMATIFTTFFGVEHRMAICLSFLVIIVYTALGGLPAVIGTDKFQSMLLIAGLILLVLFSLRRAGGFSAFSDIPASYWRPLGAQGLGDFLALALTVGPFYLVWQTTWQRVYSAQDEDTAVKGVAAGMLVSGVLLILSFLIGIIAFSYMESGTPPDLVFTETIDTTMPPIIGGLVIIGLMAAIMSGGDSFIIMGAASIARDIYQQFIKSKATDQQILNVSRLGSISIALLALIIALEGEGIIPVYIRVVKIAGAGLVFPFLALMFWRGATQKGIITSMIAGGLVTYVWEKLENPFVIEAVAGYLASLAVLVVVSFLTKHAADEQVKAAYFEPLSPPELSTKEGEGQ